MLPPLRYLGKVSRLQTIFNSHACTWSVSSHSFPSHPSDTRTQAISNIVTSIPPTSSLMNLFPWLDRLPGPLPWRVRGKKYQEQQAELYDEMTEAALHEHAENET